MSKNPKSRFTPPSIKQPRIERDPGSHISKSPSWRIRRLEMVDPFGWHEADRATIDSVRAKLADLESMTWSEILNTSQNHLVSVDKLCKEARDRLVTIRQDDLEEVLSLRLTGAQRVWGILSEGVCTLLWWDPEHRVCPSIKK